jgi:hypothetical protein
VLFAAAKQSIPICIYVTSPGQLSFRLIGAIRRYVIAGLNTLDDSGPQILGALAKLLEYRLKGAQLFRARIGKDFPKFDCVFAKNRRDQSFAFWCERHDAARTRRSSGLSARLTRPFDEAVNGRTDRAGRKVHLWPDRIHW